MRKMTIFLSVVLILCTIGQSCARAQTPQIVKVAKGQTIDLWSGTNVSGNLHLAVRTRDGKNKLNIWWITWGVGSIQKFDDWGPSGSLNIPITWWKGIVSAKLRARADDDTVVYLSEKAEIDKSFTFTW